MHFRLEYGRTGLDIDLPDDRVVRKLDVQRSAAPLPDPVGDLLQTCLTSRPARHRWPNWRADGTSACIVICDITRPVPNRDDPAPDAGHAGSRRASRATAITILIATGLHRPNVGAELVELRRPRDRRQLSHRKSSRPRARRARVPGRQSARRADLDRPPLCRGRSENHHRPDRAAFDGRLFGRSKADLSGNRRAGDREGLAWPGVPRASQRRLRHLGRQSGPRGKHLDRSAHRLRFHRQCRDRRRAPAAEVGRRRHGSGVPGRGSNSSAASCAIPSASRSTWW